MKMTAVAIGRNEGERLRACLESLKGAGLSIVYVDSGSTDGSVELAETFGARVVNLDLSIPFTAARARNAGASEAIEADPDVEVFQFIDGDCVLQPGWVGAARETLRSQPEVAVVVGTRAERYPEASIYNRLCHMELDLVPGPISWFGGDSCIRRDAFEQVGGYDESLIAGEEPDLAERLREAGHQLLALDQPMSNHDAAMTSIRQWWKRNVRGGHALAEGASRRGWSGDPYNYRRVLSVFAWTIGPIAVGLVLLPVVQAWSVAAILLYPLLMLKIAWNARRRPWPVADKLLQAFFIALGKWPEAVGVIRFGFGRITGSGPKIIEYKSTAPRA